MVRKVGSDEPLSEQPGLRLGLKEWSYRSVSKHMAVIDGDIDGEVRSDKVERDEAGDNSERIDNLEGVDNSERIEGVEVDKRIEDGEEVGRN